MVGPTCFHVPHRNGHMSVHPRHTNFFNVSCCNKKIKYQALQYI